MKIETLNDLKVFLNGLSDEQLQHKAHVMDLDEVGLTIGSADVTEEDQYLTEGDGWAPISTFEPEDENDKLEDYDIQKAGVPYLLSDNC